MKAKYLLIMLKITRVADKVTATLWWAAISLMVLLGVASAGIRIAGLDQLAVESGSMTGTFNTGDLLLVHAEHLDSLQVGQVYTFVANIPGHPLITHRVVARNVDGTYKTKGDANPIEDPWSLQTTQVVAQPKVIVPAGGLIWGWIFQNRIFIGMGIILIASLRALTKKYVAKPASKNSQYVLPADLRVIQRIVLDDQGQLISKA